MYLQGQWVRAKRTDLAMRVERDQMDDLVFLEWVHGSYHREIVQADMLEACPTESFPSALAGNLIDAHLKAAHRGKRHGPPLTHSAPANSAPPPVDPALSDWINACAAEFHSARLTGVDKGAPIPQAIGAANCTSAASATSATSAAGLLAAQEAWECYLAQQLTHYLRMLAAENFEFECDGYTVKVSRTADD